MMRIQLNQNISSATINGFSANSNLKFSQKISLESSINYIVGVDNNNNPLAHSSAKRKGIYKL